MKLRFGRALIGLAMCVFASLVSLPVTAQEAQRGTRVFIIEEDVFSTAKLKQILALGGDKREQTLYYSANDGEVLTDSPKRISDYASKGASKPPTQKPSPERLAGISKAVAEVTATYIADASTKASGSVQQKEIRRVQYIVALSDFNIPSNVNSDAEALACALSVSSSASDRATDADFEETFLHVEVGDDANISQGLLKLIVASLGHLKAGVAVNAELFDPQCPKQTTPVQLKLPLPLSECKQESGTVSILYNNAKFPKVDIVEKIECDTNADPVGVNKPSALNPSPPSFVLQQPTIDPITTLPLTGTFDPASTSFEVVVDGAPNLLGASHDLSTSGSSWKLNLKSLGPGPHMVRALSRDSKGNTLEAALNIKIAPVNPQPSAGNPQPPVIKKLPVVKPANPPTINLPQKVASPPYVIHGTSDPQNSAGLSIVVDGKSYTLGQSPELKMDGKGNWTLTLPAPLPPGEYDVKALIHDESGKVINQTTSKLRVEAEDLAVAAANTDVGKSVLRYFSPGRNVLSSSLLYVELVEASPQSTVVFLEEELNGTSPIIRSPAIDRGTNWNFNPALKRLVSAEISVNSGCQVGQVVWAKVLLQGTWSQPGIYTVGGVIADCSVPLTVPVGTMEQKQ